MRIKRRREEDPKMKPSPFCCSHGGDPRPQTLMPKARAQGIPTHLREGHVVRVPLRPLHHRRPQRLDLPRVRRRRQRPSRSVGPAGIGLRGVGRAISRVSAPRLRLRLR